MKFIIVIKDILHDGGVPNEMRSWVNSLSKKYNIELFTSEHKIVEKNYLSISSKINIHLCSNLNFYKKISETNLSKDDIVLNFGYFNDMTLLSSLFFRNKKQKVVLIPFAQITHQVFKNKIFNSNPDIKSLDSKSQKKIKYLSFAIKSKLSVIFKFIFHQLFGKTIIGRSKFIGVFSNFEKDEILSIYKKYSGDFIRFKWGNEYVDQGIQNTDFYKRTFDSKKLNFVFWGRLDFHFKGIDLLIKSVNYLKQTKAEIPFTIYLMGPDYNNGERNIRKLISNYNLEKTLIVCSREQYTSSNKEQLREADLSIYLSRWDGFPRTLRESINFNVPVLITPETHFKDFVNEYGVGFTVSNKQKIQSIAEGLTFFSKYENILSCKQKIEKCKHSLTWDNVVNDFTKDLLGNKA